MESTLSLSSLSSLTSPYRLRMVTLKKGTFLSGKYNQVIGSRKGVIGLWRPTPTTNTWREREEMMILRKDEYLIVLDIEWISQLCLSNQNINGRSGEKGIVFLFVFHSFFILVHYFLLFVIYSNHLQRSKINLSSCHQFSNCILREGSS